MEEFEPLAAVLEEGEVRASDTISYWRDSWLRLKQSKTAIFGFWVLMFLVVMAICGPWFSRYSYFENHLGEANLSPSFRYWFGTDELGRDMFCRIWWGARVSLFIGIVAALVDLAVGVIFGSLAGWIGGKGDEVMMRVADVIFSIPHLLIVILLMVVMGPGLSTIIVALTFTGWVPMARIVRGQILLLKQLDYTQAALALGASQERVLLRHLLPNAMGPIITTMTFTIPGAIFAEAFLSFLGLGIQAPVASWGTMASDGLSALRFFPWRLFFPAAFISLTMFCCNLVGDGLRDAFDPRLRR